MTTRTMNTNTVKFDCNGNYMAVKVYHTVRGAIGFTIIHNNKILIDKEVSKYDVMSILQFVDTCNVAINAFKVTTGYKDENALAEVVTSIMEILQ